MKHLLTDGHTADVYNNYFADNDSTMTDNVKSEQ